MEIAQNAIIQGLSDELVQGLTGLPLSNIEKHRNELQNDPSSCSPPENIEEVPYSLILPVHKATHTSDKTFLQE